MKKPISEIMVPFHYIGEVPSYDRDKYVCIACSVILRHEDLARAKSYLEADKVIEDRLKEVKELLMRSVRKHWNP